MSVSHKKSRSGSYYTNCSAVLAGDVDDYYTAGAKEPPGQWYFAPSPTLTQSAADKGPVVHVTATRVAGERSGGDFGLRDGAEFGEHDADHFHALCNGYSPEGGKPLVQNAGAKNHVALHDFTHTAPKTVSVVWSQADHALKADIERAQLESVREGLDFFSEKGAWTRQGKGGHIKTKTSFIAALFDHGSSRSNDPLLHTHAAVLNVCRRPDGSTGSIETKEAMRWQGAEASMYHAALAYRMREMGFAIKMDGKIPEVDGVPREVVEAFSRRRQEIEAAVEKWQIEHGMTPDAARASRGLLQQATKETRDGKNELTRAELEVQWLERGRDLGYTEQEVREAMTAGGPLEVFTPDTLLEEARKCVAALTETDATFREPTLYTAMAVHLCGRATVAQIKAAVEAIRPGLVHTEKLVNTETGEVEMVYSTQEMLVIERDLVERVKAMAPQHVLNEKFVNDYIAKSDAKIREAVMADIVANGGDPADAKGLEEEQKFALRHVCLSERQVCTVEGTAGAGKTFTARTFAAIFKAQGYDVHGLSSGWSQALNLQDEAQLDTGRAITGWLADIQSGKIVLGKKSVVIIDESGMVGARDMRNVIRAVQDAGGKVVLLGDTLQQSSVSAGDALRVVVAETGSARLDVIRRQRSEEDKKAVHEFFAGKAEEALDRYAGRLHIGKDSDTVNAKIIDDWARSRTTNPGKSHLILALDNESVDELNQLAHEKRKAHGELGSTSIRLMTMDSADDKDLREFSEGDKVVFRTNNRGLSTADRSSLNILTEYRSAAKVLGKMESVETGLQRKLRDLQVKAAANPKRDFTRDLHALQARMFDARTARDEQMRGMAKHFGENKNVFSQEIAHQVQAKLDSGDSRPSSAMKDHVKALLVRVKATESGKATDVYNRIRGTVESIDLETGKMVIRTEDGKAVDFDPADKRWAHQSGGLGIQLDYATSVYASQGLTRDIVFVKDHPAMGRKQIGVAMSRHRDDCQLYINREARYEAKLRQLDAEDWHHIDEFTDKECVEMMAKSYARDSNKESTLDYQDWRTHEGTKLYPDDDLNIERINRVREHLETIRASDEVTHELPYQLAEHYVLKPLDKADPAQLSASRDRLADDGIKGDVMMVAERQGFLSHNADGTRSFNGRRLLDDAVVNRITDGKPEAGAMRDRYPPILRGNDKEVHVVASGEDALGLWSECDRTNKARPTVIVAQGNVREATALRHVRDLLANSEKPITVHPDSRMSPAEQGAAKRNLEIAAKKEVLPAKEAASPREQAKASERVEKAAVQQQELERRRKPTLGG